MNNLSDLNLLIIMDVLSNNRIKVKSIFLKYLIII